MRTTGYRRCNARRLTTFVLKTADEATRDLERQTESRRARMTDSIIRADAVLSARRPGVTASSLRAGTEQSLRSVYSLGHSAIASLPGSLHSITEDAVTPFTLACFLVIIVEFGERFNYYTTKILYGSYCTQMLNMTSSEYNIFCLLYTSDAADE